MEAHTSKQLLTRLIAIIEDETGIIAGAEAPLRALAKDSLEFTSLIQRVEEEFGVPIETDDFATLSSVADLEQFLGQRSAAI